MAEGCVKTCPPGAPYDLCSPLAVLASFRPLHSFFDSFTLISIRSPMSTENGMQRWITRKVAGQHSAFKLILSCCTSTMLLSVTSVVIFNISHHHWLFWTNNATRESLFQSFTRRLEGNNRRHILYLRFQISILMSQLPPFVILSTLDRQPLELNYKHTSESLGLHHWHN